MDITRTNKNDNSLRQYVELFDSVRDDLDAHSCAALNSRREAARQRLEGARLPDRHTEGYERTSVNDMLAPDFGININRYDSPVDLRATLRCGVPNITPAMAVTVNDIFHPTETMERQLPQGVFFGTIDRACREIPEVVNRWLGAAADRAGSVAATLNDLLVQNGVVIYVAPGIHVEKPLQLVNLLTADHDMMAVRRLLVVVDNNASLNLLTCDHCSPTDHHYAVDQVAEIVLARGARLDMCDMEESADGTARLTMTYILQHEGSELGYNTVTLQGGCTRNEISAEILGAHCTTHINGMAVGYGTQHVDNSTMVRHLHGGSTSRQLFKYVLDDHSTGAFEGSIVVADGATLTEAYQSNRNVLASADARMHTRPQLEIYNDDVRCSHGATTGQLDAEALFYMRTRGIPEQQARTMLMQAFMADVIDAITIPGMRERLHHLVEMRFERHEAHCAQCIDQTTTTTAQ